jgi:ABC-type branched-subunit amino acid transport system ATPase component
MCGNSRFYINGTHIAKIKEKSTPTGAAGLIAISAGRFVFDNFTLNETLNAGHDASRGRAADQSGIQ